MKINKDFDKNPTKMIKLISTMAMILLLSFSTKPPQDKTITLKVTVTQANIILQGLSKLPLETSQETYMSVLTQAQQQLHDTIPPKKK